MLHHRASYQNDYKIHTNFVFALTLRHYYENATCTGSLNNEISLSSHEVLISTITLDDVVEMRILKKVNYHRALQKFLFVGALLVRFQRDHGKVE